MTIVTLCSTMGIFAVLTWFQWDLISATLVSLVLYVWLIITGSDPVALYKPGLLEYWIACLVWVGTIVFILVSQIRQRFRDRLIPRERNSQTTRAMSRWPFGLLMLLVFVSFTGPFIAPVHPHAQGNLVTTRLLPPLSSGSLMMADASLKGGGDDPYERATAVLLERPTMLFAGQPPAPGVEGGTPVWFLLGTDNLGRDVFSRLIYGTRVSLSIGAAAALGALLLGSLFGFAAGMSGGIADRLIMRFTDMVLAIPAIFLVISLVAFLGQSVVTVVLALTVTGWMGSAKMVRDGVRTLKEKEFILSARMLRLSTFRIVLRHLFPNVLPILLTALVLQFSNAVLGEAALGFLGLGVQPPVPSWGNMMGDATTYLAHAWWPGIFPGLLLSAVVVAGHYVAEHRSSNLFAKLSKR